MSENPNDWVDSLRLFDGILGCILAFGLIQRSWIRSQRPAHPFAGQYSERIAMRIAISSWFMLDLSSTSANYLRLGNPFDLPLALRLVGHSLGVIYVVSAWQLDRHRTKRNTEDQQQAPVAQR